jgi:hypothetical protein
MNLLIELCEDEIRVNGKPTKGLYQIQPSQKHRVRNHCDRCITFLFNNETDTCISFVLFNISSKFLLYFECYLLSPKIHKKVSK